MPSPESRILVNVAGVSRLLSPKGMGRIPHDLSSDFQSRKVDVDACAGPRDWPGPERGEGSSFGRVRCGQQFHPGILDLASPAQPTGLPDLLKIMSGRKSSRTSL
jgi:hypothetical protein